VTIQLVHIRHCLNWKKELSTCAKSKSGQIVKNKKLNFLSFYDWYIYPYRCSTKTIWSFILLIHLPILKFAFVNNKGFSVLNLLKEQNVQVKTKATSPAYAVWLWSQNCLFSILYFQFLVLESSASATELCYLTVDA